MKGNGVGLRETNMVNESTQCEFMVFWRRRWKKRVKMMVAKMMKIMEEVIRVK